MLDQTWLMGSNYKDYSYNSTHDFKIEVQYKNMNVDGTFVQDKICFDDDDTCN